MNIKEAVQKLGIQFIDRRPRILIVDDQPVNILVANQTLQESYDTFAATSGAQALAFCDVKVPDLILLDVIMPEMDGLEVCRRLRANPVTEPIPIIFITADSTPEQENACWEAGGSDFICKPYNPVTLLRRIQSQLTLKLQTDHLLKLVRTDGLTGICNRRHLDECLEREWQRAKRAQYPLGALMIDVDFFKSFNDFYGHQAGDECLKKVALAIASCCNRPSDIAARFGGEEFFCLLPETSVEGVVLVAQTIKEKVESLQIPHAKSDVSQFVTVSIGAAAVVPSALNSSEMIEIADGLLYVAKSKGRNQVATM